MQVLVLLSGGLDSTVALRLAMEEYGAENIKAISFDYEQRQFPEIGCAKDTCKKLDIGHEVLDISFLNTISKGFSANTDTSMKMPTIKEVLGSPQPITYVPNRNMILMSIAASYAEVNKCSKIITGLQVHDEYGYHDTTQKFVDSLNSALIQNRTFPIEILAPFSNMNKTQEIKKLIELDGNVDLLANTLTCYNPAVATFEDSAKVVAISCGKCPSCSERIQAFMNVGLKDPIPYDIEIPWKEEASQT